MPNEGEIKINRIDPTRSAVFQGGVWVEQPKGKAQTQEASMRGRMDMGLAPMIQAQQDMAVSERGGNPLNHDWGAALIDGLDDNKLAQWGGVSTGALAKKVGGQDYQDYTQASKSFEAQLMPLMSGAAVSPSEAQRQIRSALPELGDAPDTLKKKARTRAMMLNGAAKARGQPLPYPDVPTWGVNTQQVPAGGGRPGVRRYNPASGRIE